MMNNRQEIINRIYYYGLLMIAITLPLPSFPLNSICIIAIIIIWIVNVSMERKLMIDRQNVLLVSAPLALFVAYLIGVGYSSNIPDAWSSIQKKLPICFLPLVVASFPAIGSKRLNAILVSFVISCVCVSAACVIYTFQLNKELGIEFASYNNWQFSDDNLIRKFGFHHVYFAMYLCLCLVVIGHLVNSSANKYVKLGWIFISIYIVLFMMALSSRMGIIVLVVIATLAILVYLRGSIVLKLLVITGLFVATIVVGYQFPFIREKFTGLFDINLNQYNAKYRASSRWTLLNNSWSIIRDNWVFGVGTGDFDDLLLKEHMKSNYEEGIFHEYNAHNQYLDAAGCVGIMGFIAMLASMLIPFYLSLKKRDFLSLSFTLIVFLSFLTETMLARQKGIVFFALFYSLLNMYGFHKENRLLQF